MPLKLVPPSAGRRTPYWTIRGTYLGRYVERSTRTGDWRVAARMLADEKAKIERDAISGAQPVGKTFAGAAAAYMHATGVTRFMKPLLLHFRDADLASIDQEAIDSAAVAILPHGTAATRNRQVYTPVSAVLRHAGTVIALRRPKGAQGREVVHWLWPEQVARLVAAARASGDPDLPALIVLAVATGLRRSEMARISVEDIRLQESFLFITKTKSGKPRPVHLPPAAVAELSAHPSIGQESGRLFSFHIGSGLYRPLHDAYAAAGIDHGGQPLHILRHTYGTWMRRYGKIDETGMLQTGTWANPKSVRRYVHSVVSEEARKADMLPISGVFGDKKLKSLK